MKTLVFCTIAALFSAPAWAQSLTKTEAGNIALSQCYTGCMGLIERLASDSGEYMRWLFDTALFAGDSYAISGDEYEVFLETLEPFVCSSLQAEIRLTEACRAGCIDLETIYPNSSTHVRSRFLSVYTPARDEIAATGLWVSYANSPEIGTAQFETACDKFWEDEATEGQSTRVRERAMRALIPEQ